MSSPKDAVDAVLHRVEEVTGKPVLVTVDATLKMIATARAATSSNPVHLIRYSPTAASAIDYLTCFQAGIILRSAESTPEARFDVGSTYRGRKEVSQLLKEHGKKSGTAVLPSSVRDQIRDQIYDGLIIQLRSVPLGLRIDNWLRTDYPALRDQQIAMTLRQLQENLGALSPKVRSFVPAKVYDANITMNAAFALFWSKLWNDSLQISPYRAAGFLEKGLELLALFENLPSDASNDRQLIRCWGDTLKITEWFEFVAVRI